MRDTGPFLRYCVVLVLLVALLSTRSAVAQDRPTVFFLHHSCGSNLIEAGRVRQGFTALGYDFYDHGYNDEGLRLPDGSHSGESFHIPDDNTDPNGLAVLFAQPLHSPPDNAFGRIMQYDVVATKSCYPVSNISDDAQLNAYKQHYLAIRDRMDEHPDKAFIIVTQPPQVPGSTNTQEAERARAWTRWLQSPEYLAGHPNVFVFDFFGYLAGSDDMLRREYRDSNTDAHPNDRANAEIGPQFVAYIDEVWQSFEPGAAQGPVVATITEETEGPQTADDPASPHSPVSPQPLVDLQMSSGIWQSDVSDDHTTVLCGPDRTVSHERAPGESGIVARLDFDVSADGAGTCARIFDTTQDWSGSEAFELWGMSDTPGEVTLTVFSGSEDGATPFDRVFAVSGEEAWEAYVLGWDGFVLAPWDDGQGLTTIDPTRITGFGLSVDGHSQAPQLTLWVDIVGPVTGADVEAMPAIPVDDTLDDTDGSPEEQADEPSGGAGLCTGAMLPPIGLAAIAITMRRRDEVRDLPPS